MSKTIDYRKCKIEISPDYDQSNPREFADYFSTMAITLERYCFGDCHIKDRDEWFDILNRIDKGELIGMPFRAYIHSGITISTCEVYPYNDRWDSMPAGIIYVDTETVRKLWKVKRISPKLKTKVLDILEKEIQETDDWLTGNVYSYITYDPEGEYIDSCSGYIGDPETSGLLESAKSFVDYYYSRYGEQLELPIMV